MTGGDDAVEYDIARDWDEYWSDDDDDESNSGIEVIKQGFVSRLSVPLKPGDTKLSLIEERLIKPGMIFHIGS